MAMVTHLKDACKWGNTWTPGGGMVTEENALPLLILTTKGLAARMPGWSAELMSKEVKKDGIAASNCALVCDWCCSAAQADAGGSSLLTTDFDGVPVPVGATLYQAWAMSRLDLTLGAVAASPPPAQRCLLGEIKVWPG